MSFGTVQWSIITLRNNSRKKTNSYFEQDHHNVYSQNQYLKELRNKKASSKQLNDIRRKLRSHNERQQSIAILITVFLIVALTAVMFYYA